MKLGTSFRNQAHFTDYLAARDREGTTFRQHLRSKPLLECRTAGRRTVIKGSLRRLQSRPRPSKQTARPYVYTS